MRYLLVVLVALALGCCANPRPAIADNGSKSDWDRQAETLKQWQAERQACEIEGNQK